MSQGLSHDCEHEDENNAQHEAEYVCVCMTHREQLVKYNKNGPESKQKVHKPGEKASVYTKFNFDTWGEKPGWIILSVHISKTASHTCMAV